MAELESRSPVTGEVLGTVTAASEADVRAAAERAAIVQPLWAAVPARARANYLRRAAQAVLDELDRLALLIARETGRPRSEALLAELLPSVGGLHSLADDGPRALADQRLGRPALLRAGRRAVLVQAPAGVVAICGRSASPWAEPLLESAASLLAGNAILLSPAAPLVGERIAAAFIRAGVPGELIAPQHGPLGDAAGIDRVVDLGDDEAKATMLVLDGAPLDATVSGALWAAFAGAGRHPAAVGRLVVAPGPAEVLLERLVAGARRLRVGDPRHPDTEVGPLASSADVEAVERLVAEAEAGGAERLCGGALTLPGLDAAFCAPIVLRGVSADAQLIREMPPGPVLAVLEAASEREAIALTGAHADGAVSVWTDDREHGERVARSLGAELAWVNEHGQAVPSAPVRLARHVAPHRLASQSPRLRSARWLPYDPA
ncbi:MAG TPA: aldehyde dehydrogenase family protein, partial [Solirubrobacteraceae bacterium]|nr:aldehyde dehydrogenase family protein [Solirubrobacteraceae bacterium]